MRKVCTKCKTDKPYDDFRKNRRCRDGLSSWCKKCHQKGSADWAKREASKPSRRNSKLKQKYGITYEQYLTILTNQNGRCAICKRKPDDEKPLHVDHDHRCCEAERSCGNCVRGLLCGSCNRGIGLLQDSSVNCISAAEYLENGGIDF